MVNTEPFRPLKGIRVIEFGDGIASFAGRILADSGADVLKVEPPSGAASRRLGPFAGDDPHPEGSLQFWQYNASKNSMVADLQTPEGVEMARGFCEIADIVLDGLPKGALENIGLGTATLRTANTKLIYCTITPFGQLGPWADYKSCDLIQLAAGGVLSVCGYDPGDGPAHPVAPTGGQAMHLAGLSASMAILAALIDVQDSGEGQCIDVSAHDSIAVSLEMGVPFWLYHQREVIRHTARHAMPGPTPRWQHQCADGKYFLALPLYIDDARFAALVQWFESEGMAEDLIDEKYRLMSGRAPAMDHIIDVIGRFCAAHDSTTMFNESQARHLPWAPVNSPDEILADPHFSTHRGTFARVRSGSSLADARFAKMPFLVGHDDTIGFPPRLDDQGEWAKIRSEATENL